MSSVSVYIRERPVKDQKKLIVKTEKIKQGTAVVIKKTENERDQELIFDGYWDGQFTQSDVFETVGRQSCDKALTGYNATVICHGVTASGKSYTIFGEEESGEQVNFGDQIQGQIGPKYGLVPRMLNYLFNQSAERAQYEFTFHVSFIELYLDQPYDLLIGRPASRSNSRPGSAAKTAPGGTTNPTKGGIGSRPASASGTLQQLKEDETRTKLQIRQSMHGPFYADGLTVKQVKSAQEALKLLEYGYQQRTTHGTDQNERSSRSHAIFTVAVIQKSRATEVSTASLLSFVDLAGSENLSRQQTINNERQVEGQIINRTLSTLGNVISALALNKPHIPYRESKLTKLLQEALGGSSYTTMICTVYPLFEKDNETYQTLQFANRCKNVQNQPKVGVISLAGIEKEQQLKALLAEVEKLRNEKEELQSENTLLKNELEELGGKVQYVDERVTNPLLQMSDEEFNKTLEGLSPNTRNKRIQERGIMLEDYKRGGSKKLTLSTQKIQEKKAEIQQKKQEDETLGRDQIIQLRQKVKRQAQDIYNLNQQLKQCDQSHKNTHRDLKDQIEVLKETIQNNEATYQIKLQNIQKQGKDDINDIVKAQEQLFKNQQAVIESFGQKTRPSSKLAQYKDQDEERLQVIEQLEQSKTSQLTQLSTTYMQKIDDIKADHDLQLKQKDQQIDDLHKYINRLQHSVSFLYHQYRRAATIIAEAKEGKLDSYLLNEQQVMQQYMNQDFSSIRQRTKVKAAVLVDPERDVRIIPNDVMNVVNEVHASDGYMLNASSSNISILSASQGNGLSFSGRLSSRPPSYREKTVPKDFYQPHMKTGYGSSKPMNVHLNMNVHISPRPQSSRQNIVKRGEELKTLSARSGRPVSAVGSRIGSLGGTTELLNKQYQQWGY